MTRRTYTTKNSTDALPSQFELDKFWDWIEGMPVTDEMWRVDANGDMTLVVDEETMIEILSDDMAKAYNDFDYHIVQDRETGETEHYGLPYQLCGTYTIKGVYNEKQELVDEDRTYFFSQEF